MMVSLGCRDRTKGARFSGKITSAVPFGHSSVPDPDDSAESNDAAPLQAKC